jgi:hypothetical protein
MPAAARSHLVYLLREGCNISAIDEEPNSHRADPNSRRVCRPNPPRRKLSRRTIERMTHRKAQWPARRPDQDHRGPESTLHDDLVLRPPANDPKRQQTTMD